jgi:Tol biopolymer transport system component
MQPAPKPDEHQINQQIERIVTSPVFKKSKLHKDFLEWLVQRTIKGQIPRQGDIATYFGREPDKTKDLEYVRNAMMDQRGKLAQYYQTHGQEDPIRLDIPLGGYEVIFELRDRRPVELPRHNVPDTLAIEEEIRRRVEAGVASRIREVKETGATAPEETRDRARWSKEDADAARQAAKRSDRTAKTLRVWLWLGWGLLAAVGMVIGLLIIMNRRMAHLPTAAAQSYTQLTFGRGVVTRARFAPDNRNIFYTAGWDGDKSDLYSTAPGSPQSRPYRFNGARLFAISPKGDFALSQDARIRPDNVFEGTLARTSMSDTDKPRPLIESVVEADWAPLTVTPTLQDDLNGLAIVRFVGAALRLEFPVGKVLYSTAGYIAHPRFSPKGDLIPFLDQPQRGDDRGAVAVVDLFGHKQTLSTTWESTQGLAWAPDGSAIWFAAGRAGFADGIVSVTKSGKERVLLRMPAAVKLHDISSDGRVLLAIDNYRIEMVAADVTRRKEHNIAWLDQSIPSDLSPDGRQLLFTDYSEAAGPNYATCLRSLDEGTIVRLGDGAAASLSPDGKWALSVLAGNNGRPPQLALLSRGPGDSRRLPPVGITYQGQAEWLPDSQGIVFDGNQSGESVRVWLQDLRSNNPKPLTPEGFHLLGRAVSPNGKSVAATKSDGELVVFDISGGRSQTVSAVKAHEQFIQWNSNDSIYVYSSGELPAEVWRVGLHSHKREAIKKFTPADPTGVFTIRNVLLTPSAELSIFSFDRTLSTLYVVDGLH